MEKTLIAGSPVLNFAGGESPGTRGTRTAWRATRTRACSPARTQTKFTRAWEQGYVATPASLTAVDVGNRFHRWWRSELLHPSVGAALCRRHLECRSCKCR